MAGKKKQSESYALLMKLIKKNYPNDNPQTLINTLIKQESAMILMNLDENELIKEMIIQQLVIKEVSKEKTNKTGTLNNYQGS